MVNSRILNKSFLISLYSPLITQVQYVKDLLGVFDAILYMFFTTMLLMSYKSITRNLDIFLIFLILIILIIIYAQGTGNAGTAIRHRSKFIPLFIIITMPTIIHFFRARFK